REMPIAQQLVAIPCSQKTEMGHVIFANSITLTPGTVTVEAGGGRFLVHALTEDFAAPEGFAEMDKRVSAVEVR
ncbi:MAG: Na+/H+ antiporter subunit E, partial [Parvibaculum sp.]|nr:Na+/H+ antiporter subunit E [Parvibaculum sp.]